MDETNQPSAAIRRYLDKAGIAVSAMCALHCVLTIVIVSGLGVGGQFVFSEDFHRYALVAALIIAAFAIGWGAMLHRRREPFAVAMIGLLFMGGALSSPHGIQEALLTIIGVVLVSVGHIWNLRASH